MDPKMALRDTSGPETTTTMVVAQATQMGTDSTAMGPSDTNMAFSGNPELCGIVIVFSDLKSHRYPHRF